jgi:amino acid transporter
MSQNNQQGFAIASLVIGIIAIITAIIPCTSLLALLLSIISIVFGALSIRKHKKQQTPKGVGVSGLVLGIFALFLSLFWLLFIIETAAGFKDLFNDYNDFDNSNIEFEDDTITFDSSMIKTQKTIKIKTYTKTIYNIDSISE